MRNCLGEDGKASDNLRCREDKLVRNSKVREEEIMAQTEAESFKMVRRKGRHRKRKILERKLMMFDVKR